jgi:hypothetical protein
MCKMISKEDSVAWLQRRTTKYHVGMNRVKEMIEDLDDMGKLRPGFSSVDELEGMNLNNEDSPQATYVSKGLPGEYRRELVKLLKEFADCFAWSYTEMPGLSKELVEHTLPIKRGFMPHKQPARNYNQDLLGCIKEEVERLLEAKFIRTCWYVEWVSNIVLVEKKNSGKIRICVDFKNLNQATPKDEYPMLVADMLINKASGNKVISFLDGNAGYNQIFMAEDDVYKIAFKCQGFVGLFEWVVMTFGLKNVGATYQRAMNLMFHDILGVILEVHIDDLVVKSASLIGHLVDLKVNFERMRRYNLKMNPSKCAFGFRLASFLDLLCMNKG